MNRQWWKEAVVYQIYPRSFYDSNNDGIGDINGITSKLNYLEDLGVDVIWMCPVYKSPNDDNGYDISDYYNIMDECGTMEDWENLLNELHKRKIKLIMDLVINHTSDEHPWFIESKSSRNSSKRDYYIWRQGNDGKEPNNWASFFTPSAWEYDENSSEYYLHLFSKKQPDLNWKNPKVKEEIFEMIKWWLDKGIDGFRMDVINFIYKADGLPDSKLKSNSPKGYVLAADQIANLQGTHDILKELNEKLLSKYDIMTVGETSFVTPEIGSLYVAEERKELSMIFQFELMDIDSGPTSPWEIVPWKLTRFKSIISKWQQELDGKGWNSLYLNNHDQPRMVSRFGNDKKYRIESAKMLATLLHTLQGTPYMYQGEEIGMTNVAFESINAYRDIETLNLYNERVIKGIYNHDVVMNSIHLKSRDNARTPMQWNSAPNAGFTASNPWIKVNPNYKQINVEECQKDENSILNYYKALIILRKKYLALVYGSYSPIMEDHEKIFAYLRCFEKEIILVLLNFSEEETKFSLPEEVNLKSRKLLIANYSDYNEQNLNPYILRPYEALVYSIF